ncbi:MAG: pyridoxamine 5'-phosphate oxidase family protein [Bacteroidales bacterium]
MRRKDREIADTILINSIIERCDVCRIAFAVDNMPYIVTLNFGYIPGAEPVFYFHCAREGRKLEMMAMNSQVCFEMDTDHKLTKGPVGCDWGMQYSSVVGYGRLTTVNEEDERIRGLDAIMKHYGAQGPFNYKDKVLSNTLILRLDVTEITAKQKK